MLIVAILGLVPLPGGVGSRAASAQAADCPCSIWSEDDTPATASVSDSAAVELGVKFRPSADGLITGIRFYKGDANTGTHVGTLWSSTGTLLNRATFTNEPGSGWRQVLFDQPVAVFAGSTYVASYHAPNGRYALTTGDFSDAETNGPLTALQSTATSGNGVYQYGSGGFPTNSWNASNYWVDVVFELNENETTPPTVTGEAPADGSTDALTTTAVSATFSESIQPATASFVVTGPGGTVTGPTPQYDVASRTLTFSPSAPLQPSTTYAVTVNGANDAAGNTMAPHLWSFTTAAPSGPGSCPCSIWSSSDTPATLTASDTDAVEVGVKFRASESGFITGIRFYKGGAANVGPHVGKLWRTDTKAVIGTATFQNETASGWQQALFGAPVEIQANTTYIASYHAPQGRYSLDSGGLVDAESTGPLTALASGASGGNGVYRYGPGTEMPENTWNATNYWVDVVFDDAPPPDTTPPTLTARVPEINQSGVSAGTKVTGTFSEDVQANTIDVTLTGPGGSDVAGQQTYIAATRTVEFTPDATLTPAATYQAVVSGAKDAAGNTMVTATWSFTTEAGPPPPPECPCSLWSDDDVPAVPSAADNSAVELGVRFRPSENGVITGVRFYKGAANTGTHTGYLWTAGGVQLAEKTFAGESPSGWQQANFDAPVPVSANTTYVASYYAPTGGYSLNSGYFGPQAYSNGPLTALQDSSSTPNGVYRYGAHGFPGTAFQSSNYWVDVVFEPAGDDPFPPEVLQHVPASNVPDVSPGLHITATFNEPVQESTIGFELRGPGNSLVPATLSYDSNTWTARLVPQLLLAYSTTYSARLLGAKDAAGNPMDTLTWSFTTESAPPPPPDQGPGGPIAVLSTSADKFSRYTAEMLRAEGLNEFATLDMASVTAATLASYDVAVLGSMPLTAAQVTMLSDWVDAGGNLIAFKPDPQLATLLGITPASGTASDDYLKVNTAVAAAAGITSDTMQFHGVADLYNIAGATTVATLYANATTPTTHPAVTLRSVGSNGGQAAAFTYDFARSIVYTRQGNPAWAGMERDAGIGPIPARAIRTDDMYFGGAVSDWVDLSKVEIPQADEQQRLLANLVEVMNRDRKPLPRFWYFPNGHKAVIVATGDDHGNPGATFARFQEYDANSPDGCSVANWECLRATSYVFPNTPLTPADASSLDADGFEIAAHVQNECNNFTSPGALATTYEGELSAFQARYPDLPSPVSNRFHCLVWSDWSSQAKVEVGKGIRLDTNYYYWPGEWINNRPGFMTGSGMPMRFADGAGTMIDVYQAATQMTDESNQSYPFTAENLLDNALGARGYYGAFTANMHSDEEASPQSDAMMSAAVARNVPVISARQLLTWLDGRNMSSFGSVGWTGSTLSFSIDAGAGANGLQAMLPTAGPNGTTLSALTKGGAAVGFDLETIKGLEYALFSAAEGAYTATYSSVGGRAAAPSVAPATVAIAPDGTADLQWRTNEPATSEVVFGPTPESLGSAAVEAGATRKHTVSLEKLRPGATYYYRVRSRDGSGARTTWPPASQEPLAFTMPKRDKKAPDIAGIKVLPLPDGTATVTWTTSEPATSRVDFGTSVGKLSANRLDDSLVRQHNLMLTNLEPGRTYWYRVTSSDAAGNKGEARSAALRFVSSAAGVADHTTAKFRMGDRSGVIVEDPTSASTGKVALSGQRSSGRYLSRVMDAGAMVRWDRATWSASAAGNLRIAVRTGSRSTPDGSWTAWQRLSAPGDVIGTEGRFLQYRVEFGGGSGSRPTLAAIGFTHNGSAPEHVGELPG